MDYQPGKNMQQYLQAIQSLQTRVMASQQDKLLLAASRMADSVQAGGRIFLFGTGHSHILAEEAFYRAGGLAAATPIFSSALMLHEDAHLSSRLERTPGVAAGLLDRYRPQTGEMLFVYSNSGVNALPVEMALDAKARGLFVVSVSALAYAMVAPQSALGVRLDQVADLALDNGGLPGDGLLELENSEWRVGPSSTILGALLWNSLVVECLAVLQSRGVSSEKLPIFASLNMQGAAAHNQALLDEWRKINPHL
ncbi:MAG: SIS domain-containing protein [Chloroflexota bacterium]